MHWPVMNDDSGISRMMIQTLCSVKFWANISATRELMRSIVYLIISSRIFTCQREYIVTLMHYGNVPWFVCKYRAAFSYTWIWVGGVHAWIDLSLPTCPERQVFFDISWVLNYHFSPHSLMKHEICTAKVAPLWNAVSLISPCPRGYGVPIIPKWYQSPSRTKDFSRCRDYGVADSISWLPILFASHYPSDDNMTQQRRVQCYSNRCMILRLQIIQVFFVGMAADSDSMFL